MRMSITALALGGILTVGMTAGAALAQSTDATQQPPAASPAGPGPHGPMGGHWQAPNPDKQLAHLTKKLNLTADQQAQAKPLLADRAQQLEALKADTTTAPKDKRAKFRSINDDFQSKFTAILNDDQKKQYEADQQARREKMIERRQHGGPGQAPPPPPSAPATPPTQ